MRSAQPFELPVLQHAQQLGLKFERKLADLIQKQSSSVRQFEAADALGERAGEGSFFVAHQLTFDQSRRDRGAIQLNESSVRAAAQLMDRARDQLLARSGFPLNQHRRIGGRGGFDLLQYAPQRGAVADDFIEPVFAANFLFEINLFVFDALAQLADFLEHQGVFDRNGHLPRDVVHQLAILAAVAIHGLASRTTGIPTGDRRASAEPRIRSGSRSARSARSDPDGSAFRIANPGRTKVDRFRAQSPWAFRRGADRCAAEPRARSRRRWPPPIRFVSSRRSAPAPGNRTRSRDAGNPTTCAAARRNPGTQ